MHSRVTVAESASLAMPETASRRSCSAVMRTVLAGGHAPVAFKQVLKKQVYLGRPSMFASFENRKQCSILGRSVH